MSIHLHGETKTYESGQKMNIAKIYLYKFKHLTENFNRKKQPRIGGWSILSNCPSNIQKTSDKKILGSSICFSNLQCLINWLFSVKNQVTYRLWKSAAATVTRGAPLSLCFTGGIITVALRKAEATVYLELKIGRFKYQIEWRIIQQVHWFIRYFNQNFQSSTRASVNHTLKKIAS